MTGILVLGVFIILAFLSVPILTAIIIAAATGVVALGFTDQLGIVSQQMLDGINSPTLLSVPFFILAGNLLNGLQLTDRIFRFANNVVGHIRGGLAQVNILASLLFAGISGAAVADCAALGTVEVKAMRERGYPADFAAGVTAASSIIGPIFPPSIPLLIFAFVANASVGRLFLAGVLPAIVLLIVLMTYVHIVSARRNFPKDPRPPLKEILLSAVDGLLTLLAPGIILGAMLTGFTTASEAGVLACLYAMALGIWYRTLNMKVLITAFRETAILSTIALLMIGFSACVGWILAFDMVPQRLAEFILGSIDAKWQFLLIYLMFLVLIGCVFDATAALIILVPIMLPIVDGFEIDRVHFGIFTVLTLMVGILTPPIGIALYIMMDVAKLPFEAVAKATVPFLIPIVIAVLLITFVPSISLFLPDLVYGAP
ncbi:TRAP transporter large permease [Halomonas alkaliantarctica]|uniref:TRAP transporter large permease protein n=1 Tax=Halomonas alkaliantarctica TaxID=232346 RepID=A0ABY8LLU7_9GAMM|nr:TRAP transporter large permease [Halomonas alkaliantarctica]WGI24816.1 TRAP transporter large permease [Halomonas alkaliantarctica]